MMCNPMDVRHTVVPNLFKSNSKPDLKVENKRSNDIPLESISPKAISEAEVTSPVEPEPTNDDLKDVVEVYSSSRILPQMGCRYDFSLSKKSTQIAQPGSSIDPLYEGMPASSKTDVGNKSILQKGLNGAKSFISKFNIGSSGAATTKNIFGTVSQESSPALADLATSVGPSYKFVEHEMSLSSWPSLGNPTLDSVSLHDGVADDNETSGTPTPASKIRRHDDIMESLVDSSQTLLEDVMASAARSAKSFDDSVVQRSPHTNNPDFTASKGDPPSSGSGFGSLKFVDKVEVSSNEPKPASIHEKPNKSCIMRTIDDLVERHPLIEIELRKLKDALESQVKSKSDDKGLEYDQSKIEIWEKELEFVAMENRFKTMDIQLKGKSLELTRASDHITKLEGACEAYNENISAAHTRIANLEAAKKKAERYADSLDTKEDAKGQRIFSLERDINILTRQVADKVREKARLAQALDLKVGELNQAYTNIRDLESAVHNAKALQKKNERCAEYYRQQKILYDLYFSHFAGQEAFEPSSFGNSSGGTSTGDPGPSKGKGKEKNYTSIISEPTALKEHCIHEQEVTGKLADSFHGFQLLTMIENIRVDENSQFDHNVSQKKAKVESEALDSKDKRVTFEEMIKDDYETEKINRAKTVDESRPGTAVSSSSSVALQTPHVRSSKQHGNSSTARRWFGFGPKPNPDSNVL